MQHEIIATARDAGQNVVHTVTVDGEVVGTRRSAHRYAFAICEWVRVGGTRQDPVRRVVVRRWSRTAKRTAGNYFAVAVRDA